ncbi:hypothetical protein DAI22_10g092500 [Oryza sativa Japonica Group]|jgi:hypothetical protein|nr:hypothetical protein DAI22_10g092500 [Oryza sativa Japonica Group]
MQGSYAVVTLRVSIILACHPRNEAGPYEGEKGRVIQALLLLFISGINTLCQLFFGSCLLALMEWLYPVVDLLLLQIIWDS